MTVLIISKQKFFRKIIKIYLRGHLPRSPTQMDFVDLTRRHSDARHQAIWSTDCMGLVRCVRWESCLDTVDMRLLSNTKQPTGRSAKDSPTSSVFKPDIQVS